MTLVKKNHHIYLAGYDEEIHQRLFYLKLENK